ncbi:hypothetical protein FRX31_006963, partial [Thalictrum thalictroides]
APIEDTPSTSMGNDVWIIHTDGSSSKIDSGIGCVIMPPSKVVRDNVVDLNPLHISAPTPNIDPSNESDHEGYDFQEVQYIEIVLPEADSPDEDWGIPFIQFLNSGILPIEPPVLARIKRDAWLYTVIDTTEGNRFSTISQDFII